MSEFKLPNNTQRTAVLGHTGSGKTHFSVWLLSHMNYHQQPWVIIDIKEDPLLAQIKSAQEIDIRKKVPRQPGLYIAHPLPHERDEIEDFLWRLWQQGKTGLYVDESYLIPDGDALRALLVTGRSKKIPMIMVSQRPVQVPRHVFSEADFYSIFHLNDKRDKKTVNEFYPHDLTADLQRHSSRWFQVANNSHFLMKPVPDKKSILDRFEARMERHREWNGFI